MSLRQIVAAQAATAKELPLVHTTRCELLHHIVNDSKLKSVIECKVFHKHLLYFFYGRPAFKHDSGDEPSAVIDPCPVCFVFKPQSIGNSAKRVFACDSGGVHYKFFEPLLYPADRDEMELEPNLDSARRLVTLMFGSNAKYLLGDAQTALPPGFHPGTAPARYHALLTAAVPLTKPADDRRSAIEVQMDTPVALDHHLDYVILPNEKLGEPGVREAIQNDWDATPLGYDFIRYRPPGEYRTLFYEMLKPGLQRDGLL